METVMETQELYMYLSPNGKRLYTPNKDCALGRADKFKTYDVTNLSVLVPVQIKDPNVVHSN